MSFANCVQLPRLAPLAPVTPALNPPCLLRQTGAGCLSRRDHPPRLTILTMPPRHPSVSAQQAASRASGNHCPQLSLLPLRRTTHSVWVIAMMRRRLRLRSKPLAWKAISSSTLLSSQCPMKLVPLRARTPRARASPSRNDCDWNLNIPSVICARIISCLSSLSSQPIYLFPLSFYCALLCATQLPEFTIPSRSSPRRSATFTISP